MRATRSMSAGRDGSALDVVGQHVGETHERGVAVDLVGVVALDRGRDRLRQSPAAGEHPADDGVVDAELAALAVHALLGGAGLAVDGLGIARVGVHEDELADVVQERGDDQAVAVGVADLVGEQLGRGTRREGVQAEAIGRGVPDGAALEEVEGAHALGELLDGLGREDPHRVDDVLDPGDAARRNVVGHAHDGDDERDVGLDGLDDLGERNAVTADEREQAVARLGERRESLERLKRRGQTATVALARANLARGLWRDAERLADVPQSDWLP